MDAISQIADFVNWLFYAYTHILSMPYDVVVLLTIDAVLLVWAVILFVKAPEPPRRRRVAHAAAMQHPIAAFPENPHRGNPAPFSLPVHASVTEDDLKDIAAIMAAAEIIRRKAERAGPPKREGVPVEIEEEEGGEEESESEGESVEGG